LPAATSIVTRQYGRLQLGHHRIDIFIIGMTLPARQPAATSQPDAYHAWLSPCASRHGRPLLAVIADTTPAPRLSPA